MNFSLRLTATLGLALLAGAMVWNRVFAEKATVENLGGPDRYLTSVSTDKPIYKTGEKVYVRGVLLHAASHKALPAGQESTATIEIKGPKGDTVASANTQTQDSVWGFAWDVPKEQAGGEYTIRVSYPWNGHAPAERKFDIRAYRAPRLKSQIVFVRDGYGAGDKVSAALHVERAEGGIPDGAKVSVIARVDGVEIRGADARVDSAGNCTAIFDLPKEIARGEGTLALVIEDGGVVETASKTIPILLQTVDIKFYPEGGELVAGAPNRVYFEARQPNGKPADLEFIVTPNGALDYKSQTFRTEHEGRGRLMLTPQAGLKYSAQIVKPSGITRSFPLPDVKMGGAILHTAKDVFGKNEKVVLDLFMGGGTISLYKLETELDSKSWRGEHGSQSVELDPKDADGVLRVTAFDSNGTPLAERLVYREPARKLNVTITPDKKFFVPGETVKLTVKATDGDGKPVAAVVGLTATDESILEMIDKREQAPRLPVMVLLEPEVKELADAKIYLDDTNPKAALAVDLLLGTQGWRRFAFVDAEKFIRENGDGARRVLAMKMQHTPVPSKAKGGGLGGLDEFAGAPAGNARGNANVEKAKPQAAAAKPDEAPVAQAALAAAPRPVIAEDKPLRKQLAEQQLNRLEDAAQDAEVDMAAKKEIGGKDAAKRMRRQLQVAPVVIVREFAHQARPGRNPADRVDFAETLYWHAGVKTDAKTGEAVASFALNDSVTTFRILADGFNADGALGSGDLKVESVQPFYIEPKLPLEVTSGDTILLPVNVVNSIGSDLSGVKVNASATGEFKISEPALLNIKAMERVRQMMKIDVGFNNSASDFIVSAVAEPYSDKVTRKLSVKPKGFPYETPFGGMVGPEKAAAHSLTIPENVVPRSLTTSVAVYPTPLANMTEALQRLIQDPSGCFEQTSSTSYPLTMAQQYFLNHTGVDPKLVAMAREKLDAGYKRLVSFWCPDRGFEWFGENPGHEALTAFGVMHFSDMGQVRDVDASMVSQTREWLLKQRDGKGGFERKRRALHTWIEDKDCSNAYIIWALLESGEKPERLAAEIAALKVAATQSNNSYVLALSANVFALAGDKAESTKTMEKLAAKQNKDGGVDGGTASIVGSGGETLAIETTALTTLAWLRDSNFAGVVEKSMKYLADSCKAGRYGSTQSTVLALRAIVAYDKLRARPKAAGKVRVFVDGQSIGGPVAFDPTTQGAIKLPDMSELLTKGEHKIELKMEGGGEMPYSIAVNYNALIPASSKECKLGLDVQLANAEVVEGGVTEANVTITNKTSEVLPTPVAIIGLPGGLEPRHDQLKELVKKGTIDAYEVLGREVVLYWRGMAADAKVSVPLSLIAAVPGTYTAPASRAYLYYTDEFKQWTPGVKVSITPK